MSPSERPIDHYISRRNEIQLRAENISEEAGRQMWQRLGVANRHIDRVLTGQLPLTPSVAGEIERCLDACDHSLA